MSNYKKILKKSFNSQLLHCLQRQRIRHKISFSRLSAATNIPERRIRTAEHTGNMSWFELSSLLYFHHMWINVRLVNEHESVPLEEEVNHQEKPAEEECDNPNPKMENSRPES